MKIKYSVRKSKKEDLWVVWMDTQTEKGMGCRGIFTDVSRKKCYKVKKELEAAEKDFREVIKEYNRNGER